MNGHTSRTSLPATSRHSFLEYDEAGEPRVVGPPGNAAQAISPELPMTVKAAARFLGVSAQTVYLWVERKQIEFDHQAWPTSII